MAGHAPALFDKWGVQLIKGGSELEHPLVVGLVESKRPPRLVVGQLDLAGVRKAVVSNI